ncbi:1-phosphofructokinase [Oleisolibacter albus]|uniref:1-phosphofructokinase n=1 Tax=Oleisolibacter albus TaxID=2171757 RepID=UPI000DF3E62E|nr:1-phosphofructokinase [Oleisolibacter albus]
MTRAVVTLTLNPAIDQTISLERLTHGSVNRALGVQQNAGGKGVNVASCLADWGVPVVATGVLGADNAGPFEALFAAKGIGDRFLRQGGSTRTNIKLVDADGTTTDINLPGLTLDDATLDTLRRQMAALTAPDSLVVLAGSLPAGVADGIYAELVAALAAAGARVVLDASGQPLATALAAPTLPTCVKPNRHELEAWIGRPLTGRADLLDAAARLRARGIGLVVVSLGAGGALFLTGAGAVHAGLPPTQAPSTVGAGDAMVAGLVAGLGAGLSLPDTARLATAFAAGKLGRIGPHLPDKPRLLALAGQVTVTDAKLWAAGAADVEA